MLVGCSMLFCLGVGYGFMCSILAGIRLVIAVILFIGARIAVIFGFLIIGAVMIVLLCSLITILCSSMSRPSMTITISYSSLYSLSSTSHS